MVPSFIVLLGGISSYTCSLGDFNVVKMGNDGASKVICIGDVCLETNIRSKLVLKDVRPCSRHLVESDLHKKT